MSTQNKNKDDPSLLVREGDATLSLSRRNFIGATAVAVGGLRTGGGAALAGAEEAGSGKAQCDNRELTEKPNPIITGPSQAQGIARFASRTKYEDPASMQVRL
jgi:hypothetical protein